MVTNVLLLILVLISPFGEISEKQAVQVAEGHFAAGNYAEVVKTLSAAHDTAPQNAAIDYWLARAYYEQRDYDQAVAYAEQAVKWDPQNSEYHRWLGRSYGAKAEQSHSFFLARKVKEAFEVAVNLAPRSIDARRDLVQYLVEAPWIVGGDKEKARQQIESISKLDSVEGHLARAVYLSAEKRWKDAEAEYLSAVEEHPTRIEPYMEAAQFFTERKNADNLDRVISNASRINAHEPRLDFYRAVVLILRRTDLPVAESLLRSYVSKVPQRSDFPSHNEALVWLRAARS